MTPALRESIDHLVYATPDLDATVADLARALGVAPGAGGAHPGRGTRNALVGLGPRAYLEIVGPDADQPAPDAPRWFGIDGLVAPRLVTWAAAAPRLDERAGAARATGLGPIAAGRRQRPDGVELSWRFTDPRTVVAEGVVPFLIDWGASLHPAAALPPGVELVDFRAEHPDPACVRALLTTLGLDLPVTAAPRPALVAELQGPTGRVLLR